MTNPPMPIVCSCGFSTMDATKAVEHADKHKKFESLIVVRGAESLGLKSKLWALAFTLPSTGHTWYREFYYKADAEKLRQELLQRYLSREAILDHYGAHFFQELDERRSRT